MRKKGDANDAPATHIQDATINTYCVTDEIRSTLSLYFITEFAKVGTSISLKSKIINAAQEESTCLLFSFHVRGVPKKHYLPSHPLDLRSLTVAMGGSPSTDMPTRRALAPPRSHTTYFISRAFFWTSNVYKNIISDMI